MKPMIYIFVLLGVLYLIYIATIAFDGNVFVGAFVVCILLLSVNSSADRYINTHHAKRMRKMRAKRAKQYSPNKSNSANRQYMQRSTNNQHFIDQQNLDLEMLNQQNIEMLNQQNMEMLNQQNMDLLNQQIMEQNMLNQQMIDQHVMEQSNWAADEAMKMVTPFEMGGYDMTQGNSFNDYEMSAGLDFGGGFDTFDCGSNDMFGGFDMFDCGGCDMF